jgi:hypothetical protein
MNRRQRRAIARDVIKKNGDLHGREKQQASSALARELLQMRAVEGRLKDAEPRVVLKDHTGTEVRQHESGLLTVETNISRGAK